MLGNRMTYATSYRTARLFMFFGSGVWRSCSLCNIQPALCQQVANKTFALIALWYLKAQGRQVDNLGPGDTDTALSSTFLLSCRLFERLCALFSHRMYLYLGLYRLT